MTHDRYRELLCLALYDELDSEGRAALALHLQGCGQCRNFETELRGGLGRLAGMSDSRATSWAAGAQDDLPTGWHDKLLRRIDGEPRRRWARALPFAAGLAAGIALAFVLRSPPEEAESAPGTAPSFAHIGPPFVPRSDAPLPAEGLGALAHLVRRSPR